MSKDKDKWLDSLRERLNDCEQEPPQGLWDDLQARLQHEGWTRQPRRRATQWALWSRWAGVAACVAVALVLTFTHLPHWQQDTAQGPAAPTIGIALHSRDAAQASAPSAAQASTDHAQATSTSALLASTRQPSSTTGTRLAHRQYTQAQATSETTAHTSAQGTPEGEVAMLALDEAAAPTPTTEAQAQAAEEATSHSAAATAHAATSAQPQERAVATAAPSVMTRAIKHESHASTSNHRTQTENRAQERERLTLAAYTAGSAGTQLNARDMGHSPVSALGPDEASWEDNPSLGMAIFNQGKATERTVHHRLPVRVGASVSYGLTDRLALGSGLSYTRLHSDLREGSGDNYMQGTQTLHYVGIPVTLHYTLLRLRGLELYALGGAQADLRVAGKVNRNYVLDGESRGGDTRHIQSHPLQMSARLAAGVQYRFMPTLALYAEPGIVHYFGDGSSVPTIFKERPTDFSLSLGLRLCVGK